MSLKLKKIKNILKNNKIVSMMVLALALLAAISIPFLSNIGLSRLFSDASGASVNTRISRGDNYDRIHFINVGTGDMILLESQGQFALIDGGREFAGKAMVKDGSYLDYILNGKKLSYVILTHDHTDHSEGLQYIVCGGSDLNNCSNKYIDNKTEFYFGTRKDDDGNVKTEFGRGSLGRITNILELIYSQTNTNDKSFQVVNNKLYKLNRTKTKKYTADYSRPINLKSLELGEYTIDLLNSENDTESIAIPGVDGGYKAIGDCNRDSIIELVTYKKGKSGEKTILLTGDMEVDDEYRFLNGSHSGLEKYTKSSSKKIDIYKMGHHGSYTSNSVAFMKALQPSTVITTRATSELFYRNIPYGAIDAYTYLIKNGSQIYHTGFGYTEEDIVFNYDDTVTGKGEAIVVDFDGSSGNGYSVKTSNTRIDTSVAYINKLYTKNKYESADWDYWRIKNPMTGKNWNYWVYKNSDGVYRGIQKITVKDNDNNDVLNTYYFYDRNVLAPSPGFHIYNDRAYYHGKNGERMYNYKENKSGDYSYNKSSDITLNNNYGYVNKDTWLFDYNKQWVYIKDTKIVPANSNLSNEVFEYLGDYYYFSKNPKDPFMKGSGNTRGVLVNYIDGTTPSNSSVNNKIIYPIQNEREIGCTTNKDGKTLPNRVTLYKIYMFDESGVMKTGNISKDGKLYRFDNTGKLVSTTSGLTSIVLQDYTTEYPKDATYWCDNQGYCMISESDPTSIPEEKKCTGATALNNNTSEAAKVVGDVYITGARNLLSPAKDGEDEYSEYDYKEFYVKYNCGDEATGEAPAGDSVLYGELYTVNDSPGTCQKNGYKFAGYEDPIGMNWTYHTVTWTFEDGQYGIDDNTLVLTAIWEKELSVFKPGPDVNIIIRNFEGSAGGDNITSIVRTEELPDLNSISYEIVSTMESEEPIYMWYENGTVYWYSASPIVYMNQNAERMFSGLSYVTSIDLTGIDTSDVIVMDYLFLSDRSLTSLDLSGFDTSKVIRMIEMFSDCRSLTNLDLSSFDTSNTQVMSWIFSGCDSLEVLNLSGWSFINYNSNGSLNSSLGIPDSIKVLVLNNAVMPSYSNCAFCSLNNLETIYLNKVDTSHVTDMTSMFGNCPKLSSINISSFDISNVTTMYGMFNGSNNLRTIYAKDSFTIGNNIDTTNMFYDATSLVGGAGTVYDENHKDGDYAHIDSTGNPGYFTEGSDSILNFENQTLTSGVTGTEYSSEFIGANNCIGSCIYEIKSGAPEDALIESDDRILTFGEFATAGTYEIVVTAYDTSTRESVDATLTVVIAKGDPSIQISSDSGEVEQDSSIILGAYSVATGTYEATSSNPSIATVTKATSDEVEAGQIIGLKVNGLKKGTTTITVTFTPTDLDNYNNVTVTKTIDVTVTKPTVTEFKTGAEFNSIIKSLVNGNTQTISVDTNDLNITAVEKATEIPSDIQEKIDNNTFDIVSVVSSDDSPELIYAWYKDSKIYWYTDSAEVYLNENSASMFYSLQAAQTIDLSGVDTSNVTTMSAMFGYDIQLTNLDLSGFDTSYVTDMTEMFISCQHLTSLDLSSFNTSNVTRMISMFENCYELSSLNIRSFNTSKVTSMYNMFMKCHNLTSINLTGFDTSNVTSIGNMFNECYSLTSLDLSSFDTSNVTDMQGLFYTDSELVTIYASDRFVVSPGVFESHMFYYCPKLVGGAGTTYNAEAVSSSYAHIDGGEENPGYFTEKEYTQNKYTINYSCGSGTGDAPESQITYTGTNTTISTTGGTCVKDGHKFNGWNTSIDGTGFSGWTNWAGPWVFENGEHGISDYTLTLYADWVEDSDLIIIDPTNMVINNDKFYIRLQNVVSMNKGTLLSNVEDSENVQVYNKNNVEITDDSAKTGTGSTIKKGNKEYKIIIYGDVDGTGTVNANDMRAIYTEVKTPNTLSGINYEAADYDNTGRVNANDLRNVYALIKSAD